MDSRVKLKNVNNLWITSTPLPRKPGRCHRLPRSQLWEIKIVTGRIYAIQKVTYQPIVQCSSMTKYVLMRDLCKLCNKTSRTLSKRTTWVCRRPTNRWFLILCTSWFTTDKQLFSRNRIPKIRHSRRNTTCDALGTRYTSVERFRLFDLFSSLFAAGSAEITGRLSFASALQRLMTEHWMPRNSVVVASLYGPRILVLIVEERVSAYISYIFAYKTIFFVPARVVFL